MAGQVLWPRGKDRYSFDLCASLQVRDRQRVVLQNIWRRKQGLPEQTLPEVKTVARAPEAQTRPLLDQFIQSTDVQAQEAARRLLEKLGLAALPELLAQLKNLPQGHAAHAGRFRLLFVLVLVIVLVIGCALGLRARPALARRQQGLPVR